MPRDPRHAPGSSSSRSSAACSPACSSTASAPRSRRSTRSTWRAARGAGVVAPSVEPAPRAATHRRRLRHRLAARALPQRPGLRLQEPVPEHHPHLQPRSADATSRRAATRTDRRRGPERRALPARRARHPARARGRRWQPNARRPSARGDSRQGQRDQDPDELPLRRARRQRLAASSRRRSPTRSPTFGQLLIRLAAERAVAARASA